MNTLYISFLSARVKLGIGTHMDERFLIVSCWYLCRTFVNKNKFIEKSSKVSPVILRMFEVGGVIGCQEGSEVSVVCPVMVI